MRGFSKKWGISIMVVAAVAAAGFVTEHFIEFNPISRAVNTVTVPIKGGFAYIAHSLESARDFVWEMRAYKADNEKLEAENIELRRENRDTAAYREENERLKALLYLKESMENTNTVAAKVISYSDSNWLNRVEINRGTIHGVKQGNVVITPDGVVGKVTEAGPNYAIVTTILDKGASVGIMVSRTGCIGLVEGDTELVKDAQCKLSVVDSSSPIIVGDVLETSGTGGTYPSGLVVGTVMHISADSAGSLNYAVVDPAVEFDKVREVLVVVG